MSTYTPIASQTLASAAASVTFTGIPQGYTDLVLNLWGKAPSANLGVAMQFNSDTSASYSYTQFGGNGSVSFSNYETNITYARFGNNTQTDGTPTQANIQNYANSTTYKSILSRSGSPVGGGTVAFINLWRNTSPITSLTITPEGGGNWGAGSTFDLYGIAVGSPKASGGNTVTTDGTYWYHTFTSSGVFTPAQALTADYLVVAGGGGGGTQHGGGGGAGGLRCTVGATGGGGSLESALSLTAQAYTVTIGAGGAGSPPGGNGTRPNGTDGSNSVFSTITSIGGGGGASYRPTTALNGNTGGSGGAGAGDDASSPGTGGAGTANQGYAGGNGMKQTTGIYRGGGGGGAGAVGEAGSATTTTGGAGGIGVATIISGTSTYYAGGGGGACSGTGATAGGLGGTGGGGAGGLGFSADGNNGTANTGGGAGAGGSYNNSGGAGGSGIVIIRYAV